MKRESASCVCKRKARALYVFDYMGSNVCATPNNMGADFLSLARMKRGAMARLRQRREVA